MRKMVIWVGILEAQTFHFLLHHPLLALPPHLLLHCITRHPFHCLTRHLLRLAPPPPPSPPTLPGAFPAADRGRRSS